MEDNAKGTTDKTVTFNWNAPHAGIAEVTARVVDSLGQASDSAPLPFTLEAPLAPPPTPQVYSFDGTWTAISPAARFDATFSQIGRALRGVFVEKRADGTQLTGKIVSGAASDKLVLFAVDFSDDGQASAGSLSEHTLVFDCSFQVRPPKLTCNYTTENGERGSSIFTPSVQQ
jgi:hypothetical protein